MNKLINPYKKNKIEIFNDFIKISNSRKNRHWENYNLKMISVNG